MASRFSRFLRSQGLTLPLVNSPTSGNGGDLEKVGDVRRTSQGVEVKIPGGVAVHGTKRVRPGPESRAWGSHVITIDLATAPASTSGHRVGLGVRCVSLLLKLPGGKVPLDLGMTVAFNNPDAAQEPVLMEHQSWGGLESWHRPDEMHLRWTALAGATLYVIASDHYCIDSSGSARSDEVTSSGRDYLLVARVAKKTTDGDDKTARAHRKTSVRVAVSVNDVAPGSIIMGELLEDLSPRDIHVKTDAGDAEVTFGPSGVAFGVGFTLGADREWVIGNWEGELRAITDTGLTATVRSTAFYRG